MTNETSPDARSPLAWKRYAARLALGLISFGWIYSTTYHTWTNYSHVAPLLAGVLTCWLLVDAGLALLSLIDGSAQRYWRRYSPFMGVCAVGVAALTALAILDPKPLGFEAHDQAALDAFWGAMIALFRYFLRIPIGGGGPIKTRRPANPDKI